MHDETAAESDPPSEKDTRITEIISEFSEIFTFARTRWARYAEDVHPELRGVGLMILQLVLKKGPVTATEISQMLDMDKATVSRQVASLRDMDLIVAEPVPEDRRVSLLRPSPLAQEQFAKIRIAWAESYHERFSDWSMDDLEVLQLGLHRFNAASTEPTVEGPAARCSRGQNHAEADAAAEASSA